MTIDDPTREARHQAAPAPMRPLIAGTRHMVVAGHALAAHAGFTILEAGGNAIDAGVGAAIALAVVESELVNVAGVAPMIIRLAETGEVVTIDGLGHWPAAMTSDLFMREHGGQVPDGILRTVVPAAPDAWITALERYGTLGFGDVAGAAIRFAGDGFVMYPLMAELIAKNADSLRRWPANEAIYLPGGSPPEPGDRFVQTDLAGTLQYMVDEERAVASKGRQAGLTAARDAFYRGDIAAAIVAYHKAEGGLLAAADLADFAVEVAPPVSVPFADSDIYTCGPWCQGPALAQTLGMLSGIDLAAMGHNSPAYVHTVAEALKLAFADRERYYGDPRFVDVPIEGLLSAAYAEERRRLIRPDVAWPGMAPAGDPRTLTAELSSAGSAPAAAVGAPRAPLDTSYVCTVDGAGNVFSATPSDIAFDTPVIPGTGLCVSSRGSQSWGDPDHPSSVAPGKRPRLTPNPALAIDRQGRVTAVGTPGGDVQVQAMVQALLNVKVFGMDAQSAVEAPRFAVYSFPDSFAPHETYAGRLNLEAAIADSAGTALAELGHDVHGWPEKIWLAGSVCMLQTDPISGIHNGAADPRRTGYALGW
jgi:gamma-glutamyltranspeptidase / glutathione hydrolase